MIATLMVLGLLALSCYFAWVALGWKCKAIEWREKSETLTLDNTSLKDRLDSKSQSIEAARKRIEVEQEKAQRQAEMRCHFEELYQTADARVKVLTHRLVKIQNIAAGGVDE